MRKRILRPVLLSVAVFLCYSAFTHVVTAQDAVQVARIERLVKGTGLPYDRVGDDVWVLPFEGESLKKFNVLVGTGPDFIVIFVVMAEKKTLRITPELMRTMLELNGDLDRVKIGFDKQGDAFVRIDLGLRVLDTDELKTNIEILAAATDKAHKSMKRHIVTTR